MARPWFNSRSVVRVGMLVLTALLATSCLELAVSVDFRTSTAGQIQVDALALRVAQGLQVVEGSDRVAFPGTRAEWQTVVDQVPGASLVSWTGSDTDLGFKSQTVLGFSNARALEGLFVVFKQKLTLLQSPDGQWTLTFVPQVPRLTGGDPEGRRLWTALWGSQNWIFGFTPPGKPRVDHSVFLAALAGPQPPDAWTLTW